jgi:hypothetical protein
MPTVVVGVPGLWKTRTECIEPCLKAGFLFAGLRSVVMDVESKKPCPFMIEVYDPDPDLRRSFEIAGLGRIPKKTLEAIERNTMTYYVVAEGSPSVELAAQVMRFAGALLDAGGLAVKVETAGVAHTPERWRELLAYDNPAMAALHALTLRVMEPTEDETYSAGMHALGLPDAEVPGATPEHASLLDTFAKYLLLERPEIKDGQTFSVSAEAPRYRLRHGPCDRFEPDHTFHNPHGVWTFTPE